MTAVGHHSMVPPTGPQCAMREVPAYVTNATKHTQPPSWCSRHLRSLPQNSLDLSTRLGGVQGGILALRARVARYF